MRLSRCLAIACLVLTACSAPAAEDRGPTWQTRLPTRLPTRLQLATPTVTPFAVAAQAYYDLGVERRRTGDVAAARQYFTWAIRRDPAFVQAYVSRGALSLAEGRVHEALRDADAALEIEAAPKAYILRAEVLRRRGRYQDALHAFDEALDRNPSLAEETFPSRWEAALGLEDEERLHDLASEYAARHPDQDLAVYYQAWASLAAECSDEAIDRLVPGIAGSERQTALLWYLLGLAYVDIEAWQEAVLSLETARGLLERNDTSLAIHTEQPVAELFAALGEAYLGAGRCADAESMLLHALSVGASRAELGSTLERARICPTATPLFPGGVDADGER